MSGSYERINYQLRPAKTIERKMLCEAFRRLYPFGEVRDYRYIGFGSTYFSDFILIHKTLGIENLISIEKDIEKRDRFLFNRPFSCIEIEFGNSTDILPALDWNVRTIIWLDYDGKLIEDVLADIGFFCSSASSGSVIVISVNVHPDSNDNIPPDDVEEIAKFRLQQLADRVREERIPRDTTGKELKGWGIATASHKIIRNEIDQILKERNGGRQQGNKMVYEQLFNFHYSDGAKMLTTGGIIFDQGQSSHYTSCNYNALPFIRNQEDSYEIDVPCLTYREIRHLEAQHPISDSSNLNAHSIPDSDLEMYSKVYKYFPTFSETDI